MAGFEVKYIRSEYIPINVTEETKALTYGELLDLHLAEMVMPSKDGDHKGMLQDITLQLSEEDTSNLRRSVESGQYPREYLRTGNKAPRKL